MSMDRPASGGHGGLLRQSLDAINSLEAKIERLEREQEASRTVDLHEPIALVGAACRFPGRVNDLDSYWRLLENGADAVTNVPPERSQLVGWKSADRSKWSAGLLDGIDQFDPQFFGISAREASTMDPQQRLVLEAGWGALEDSGYAPGGLAGSSTGVFIGVTTSDYGQLIHDSACSPDVYIATGNAHNAIAGRLSFTLGLQGPSMAVDTACSSSLVAVHLACLSLRASNCRMALAGGVNVLLSEEPFAYFQAWGMMSPDGKCKPFDSAANGFVRSEGCGVVVLKRLSDALADGDHIRAIIRGSAVNQDGRSSGLTVPNGLAQEAVIRQALASAGLEPSEIDYVEAHGTGTALGDPIEAQALAAVLGVGRSTESPLVLGSVKANLGHTESAAGVAGLLKVMLSLEHECIPAQLHFKQKNPQIDWTGTSVEIPVQRRAWHCGRRRRIAGISSFGFSGTNAHLILEEPPRQEKAIAELERPLHIATFSARTADALETVEGRIRDYLQRDPAPLPDIAHTCNTGRTHFRERLAVIARDGRDLREKLAAGKVVTGVGRQVAGKLAFLFTGQGSQWPGMCRELYDTQPVFRDSLDECAAGLRLERPLLDVIYGSSGTLLEQTAYTQPALFAIEWSLAQLWKSFGIEPDVVFGHSVGEYAALCVAGVWTLVDGLRLITERARLMQLLGPGWGMTAAQAGPDAIKETVRGLEEFVSIAARNAPGSTVISGRLTELAEVEIRLAAAGIRSVRLPVSHGFHSSQMEHAAKDFARLMESVETRSPRCGIVSSVTGRFVDRGELAQPDYWRRQVRDEVQFQAGMITLRDAGYDIFLEIGPTPTLCGLGNQCIGSEGLIWAPSIRRERGAWEQILESLAQLYVTGTEVDWRGYDAPYARRRVALPTYPFDRHRCWFEKVPESKSSASAHPLLGVRFAVAGIPESYIWESEISTAALPYLEDHSVQGTPIFPATGYIEMTVAAAREVFGDVPVEITEIEFSKPLFVTADPVRLQLSFSPGDRRIQIQAKLGDSGQWILCSRNRVNVIEQRVDIAPLPDFSASSDHQISGNEFYTLSHERGNLWGPAFQGMRRTWISGEKAWSEIEAPELIRAGIERYCVHPAVADACGHVLAAIASSKAEGNSSAFVGQAIDSVCVYKRPKGVKLLVHGELTFAPDSATFRGDVRVFDEDGTLVSYLRGAQMRYLDQEPAAPVSEWFYRLDWHQIPSRDSQSEVREWLVLGSGDTELTDALVRIMRKSNIPVTALGERSAARLQEVFASSSITGVVCLWGLDAHEPAGESTVAACGAESLLQLVRVMAEHTTALLWVVTLGLEDIGDTPCREESLWQAPLRGLARSVAVEHPELWGGLIDLDPACSFGKNADAIWSYLQAPGREDQIALRDGRVLAARLERSSVPESPGLALRRDCTYLITGGLGGLGMEVAHWLVTHGATRLLLIGRTPLPDRSTWRDLSADDAQAPQVAAIQALERVGATVHLGFLDVGDNSAVNRFLADYKRKCWPPIRGVVHAAGILDHRLLAEVTSEEFERSLRPKTGALALDRALEGEPLDFFIMFSSASALLSTPRLGAYAAANSFLDALASRRRRRGVSALSVNWGVWSEAGFASRFASSSVQALAERGLGGMTNEQALSALERLMLQPVTQAAVMSVDWKKWAERYPIYSASPLLASLFRMEPASTAASSGQSRPKPHSHSELSSYLVGALAAILGFNSSELNRSIPINSFGLDSLTALEFKHQIESELGLKMSTVHFLKGPTLEELCAEITPLLEAHVEAAPIAGAKDGETLQAQVDDLTEAELDSALAGLLKEIGPGVIP
jgi:acyl transferase domain-containing protein